jgi:hypothetical protein
MDNADSGTAEPVQTPSKSFLSRVLGVFWSPGETFEDIARKPDFVAPLILLIVTSVAAVETMLAKIGAERIIRASLEQSGRAASMSPEQIQQAVQRGAPFVAILTHIAGALGTPIFLLVLAAFGLLVVNAIFGGKTGFKKIFSVTCYSFMPKILAGVMMVAVVLLGDPEQFNSQNPAPTNPGYFMAPSASRALVSLASSFDIFTLWVMVLISIGLSAATDRQVKTRSIFLVFFGVWLLLVLAKAGFALLAT